jgi:hypothetical protein
MDIPFKAITGLAALSSYALVTYFPHLLPYSQPSYLGTFAQIWIVEVSISLFWQVILYPKYFSPLRHLPGPEGGSWWCGYFFEIIRRPSGEPIKEW